MNLSGKVNKQIIEEFINRPVLYRMENKLFWASWLYVTGIHLTYTIEGKPDTMVLDLLEKERNIHIEAPAKMIFTYEQMQPQAAAIEAVMQSIAALDIMFGGLDQGYNQASMVLDLLATYPGINAKAEA